MGLAGDPRARLALEGALGDGEARVRVEAALALARLGWRDRSDAVLTDELGGELFRDAPLRAARALALLGDDSGYGRVTDALASALASNRAEAVAALSVFVTLAGPGTGIDPVGALLAVAGRDPEPLVRGDALTAMAGTGDPRVAGALVRARRDADPGVRAIAERLSRGAAE